MKIFGSGLLIVVDWCWGWCCFLVVTIDIIGIFKIIMSVMKIAALNPTPQAICCAVMCLSQPSHCFSSFDYFYYCSIYNCP